MFLADSGASPLPGTELYSLGSEVAARNQSGIYNPESAMITLLLDSTLLV